MLAVGYHTQGHRFRNQPMSVQLFTQKTYKNTQTHASPDISKHLKKNILILETGCATQGSSDILSFTPVPAIAEYTHMHSKRI